MAEFLTTSGIAHHLENIITGAKKKVVLISPYLKISKTFLERLKDANDKRVNIIIIYGKDELRNDELKNLTDLHRVELHYFENLHAKCYYNEEKMIVTSMNMYEFSEKNNREMGILIDANSDKQIYDKAIAEAESILKASKILPNKFQTNPYKRDYPKKHEVILPKSYCIRCKEQLNYIDLTKPFCKECYYSWAEYENPFYVENYCLLCGKEYPSTMDKPVCKKCYK